LSANARTPLAEVKSSARTPSSAGSAALLGLMVSSGSITGSMPRFFSASASGWASSNGA